MWVRFSANATQARLWVFKLISCWFQTCPTWNQTWVFLFFFFFSFLLPTNTQWSFLFIYFYWHLASSASEAKCFWQGWSGTTVCQPERKSLWSNGGGGSRRAAACLLSILPQNTAVFVPVNYLLVYWFIGMFCILKLLFFALVFFLHHFDGFFFKGAWFVWVKAARHCASVFGFKARSWAFTIIWLSSFLSSWKVTPNTVWLRAVSDVGKVLQEKGKGEKNNYIP